jgi:hypothetical protein
MAIQREPGIFEKQDIIVPLAFKCGPIFLSSCIILTGQRGGISSRFTDPDRNVLNRHPVARASRREIVGWANHGRDARATFKSIRDKSTAIFSRTFLDRGWCLVVCGRALDITDKDWPQIA